MFNSFKATVRRLVDLPWEDLRDLFSWSGSATVQADNPNLLIAKAADASGEVLVYVTAEPILLVDGYVVNPRNTIGDSQEVGEAGDAIDAALAQSAGVQRMWVVIPDDVPPMEGEKCIRVYERKVYQPFTSAPRLGCCDLKPQPMTFN